jgi:hypothetical protein
MATISSVFIGSVDAGTWASAVLGGTLAGGGEHMEPLFEFYHKIQEDIEANLSEPPSSPSRICPVTGL